MPKITIHQEIWAKVRPDLIESVALVLRAFIALCLLKALLYLHLF